MKRQQRKPVFCLVVLLVLGSMLSGCQEMNSDAKRIPRYTYEELQSGTVAGNEEAGYFEGFQGDVMETIFFDYRVEHAQFVSSFEGYVPAKDCQLLEVTVSIQNTFGTDLPMFNTDFQVQWGEAGEDDYRYGLSELALLDAGLMPEEYLLGADEMIQYRILFEVPAGYERFSLSYLEIFEDGSEGSLYFVYFEPVSLKL